MWHVLKNSQTIEGISSFQSFSFESTHFSLYVFAKRVQIFHIFFTYKFQFFYFSLHTCTMGGKNYSTSKKFERNLYMLSLYTKIISFLAKSWYKKTCGALKLTRYIQTWVNDHIWITTNCLQRPLFWYHNFNFHNVKLPLNNDHLSTMATNFESLGWSL